MSKGRRKEIAFEFGKASQKIIEALSSLGKADFLIRHSMRKKYEEKYQEQIERIVEDLIAETIDKLQELERAFLERNV